MPSLFRPPVKESTHTKLYATQSVLRICANSIQFLPTPLLQKLESELGESADGLSTHYQKSAQILSNYLSPGEGGLKQVQQLFLGATWLKAEAEFVKAWHAVGAAVREGQEIGTRWNLRGLEL